MPFWQSLGRGVSVADESEPALLGQVATGINSLGGLEVAVSARPAQFQLAGNLAWARRQSEGNPAMRRDYLQAAARHPHVFQTDDATIVSHVETVVSHFAKDGLTRPDYFKAVAAEPGLLLQKPATVINNLEKVMDHYAADQLMRSDYLQAAVDQPILFRTPPENIIATIEAMADRLEAQGVTRIDCLRQAVDRSRLFTQGPEAIRRPTSPETSPPASDVASPSQPPASSPLPSTAVQNPVLCVSYVDPAQGFTR